MNLTIYHENNWGKQHGLINPLETFYSKDFLDLIVKLKKSIVNRYNFNNDIINKFLHLVISNDKHISKYSLQKKNFLEKVSNLSLKKLYENISLKLVKTFNNRQYILENGQKIVDYLKKSKIIMDILRIYLICFNNKKLKLAALLILVLFGTFLETLSIGLLIPLLSIIANEISEIHIKISEIFTNIPFILNYLLSLDKFALIVLSLTIITIIFTLKTIFLIFVGWFSARFIYDIQRKLSKTLFSSYLNRPYSFFLNKNSSELMRNTTGEVGVFVGQVLIPLVYLFTESTVVIFLTIFLLYIEPVGTLIVFLFFLIFIFFFQLFN